MTQAEQNLPLSLNSRDLETGELTPVWNLPGIIEAGDFREHRLKKAYEFAILAPLDYQDLAKFVVRGCMEDDKYLLDEHYHIATETSEQFIGELSEVVDDIPNLGYLGLQLLAQASDTVHGEQGKAVANLFRPPLLKKVTTENGEETVYRASALKEHVSSAPVRDVRPVGILSKLMSLYDEPELAKFFVTATSNDLSAHYLRSDTDPQELNNSLRKLTNRRRKEGAPLFMGPGQIDKFTGILAALAQEEDHFRVL